MQEKQNKMPNYGVNNWQEVFFITQVLEMTSLKARLLNFPNGTCFTFCLKEMISICNVTEEISNKSYFKLADSFYNFMLNDKIFEKVDRFQYFNLLKKLKKIVDKKNDINVKELRAFFQTLLRSHRKSYQSCLIEKLNLIFQGIIDDTNEIEKTIDTFLNELLSMGYSFKYLSEIFDYYFHKNSRTKKFNNLNELVQFLFEYSIDNYDMYLPLKNITKRDVGFLTEQYGEQKVELGSHINNTILKNTFLEENVYYCHIYFSLNDYIRGLEDNIKRTRSIMNVLKFYTNSQVDFDYSKNTYIRSNKLGIEKKSSIREILQHSYFQGTEGIINNISKNFTLLKNKNSTIIEEVFDIMNYSQKDSDILSSDQFVSKWISLEMTSGKNGNRKGFDAVLKYVPRYLSVMCFRQKLNYTIKKSGVKQIDSVEKFVRYSNDPNLENLIREIPNPYYRHLMKNYSEMISNIRKIKVEIDKESLKMEENIYRIYMLRNKYVHSGDTTNYNDIFRYVLNALEPLFVDKIIKTINEYIDYNEEKIDKFEWNFVFNELDYKYEVIDNILNLSKENFKPSSTRTIKLEELCDEKETQNLIINILLERHFKMFIHADSNKKNNK